MTGYLEDNPLGITAPSLENSGNVVFPIVIWFRICLGKWKKGAKGEAD